MSCNEEEASMDFKPSPTGGIQSTNLLAMDDVKNTLFNYASETVSGMYPVSFQAKKTKKLSKKELISWIKKNEAKKSAKINRGNRKILGKLLEQDIIEAILLETDQQKPFRQAVYVLIPEHLRHKDFIRIGAILVTDEQSDQSGAAIGDDEEEEPEEPCFAQFGTYIDATNVQASSSGLSGCPPCLVVCVDCEDPAVGEDCIWCEV
jgi:hypothetical protein